MTQHHVHETTKENAWSYLSGMLLEEGMENGEWRMGNGEWGMENGEGEWEIENEEWEMGALALWPRLAFLSLRSQFFTIQSTLSLFFLQ